MLRIVIARYPGKQNFTTFLLCILKNATNDKPKGLTYVDENFIYMYDGNNNDHGTPRATTACSFHRKC